MALWLPSTDPSVSHAFGAGAGTIALNAEAEPALNTASNCVWTVATDDSQVTSVSNPVTATSDVSVSGDGKQTFNIPDKADDSGNRDKAG